MSASIEPGLVSDAATHPGAVRKRNEDSLVHRPDLGLWAVADGAGGHGAGDVASQAVAAALEAIPPGLSAAEILAQARLRLAGVHAELQAQAVALGEGRIIATTIVLLLARYGHFACLWAGDSRAYLMRGGILQRVTRDHSLVQEMVDQGTLTEAEAEAHPQANVILRAVGASGELVLDKVSGRIAPGDMLLLCSDGLFKAMPEEELAVMLAQGATAAAIIDAAVARGARDNVSVVLLRYA
ncbi:MAG: Protein serine/threonine phosphatase PrpC, regulation of stationary phase [uncultured Craurococcus sp.]|uniref:Protein serine/threonine phosphatase PrpC, regulation of stationary phase n=1 Tax=uncultured Craurococcus sp. TaxID=1135998 RepID=A0A6J4I415_9PROT|nr:MAG: Protein serine/threonine phosphatase PrpC, regulation of stationary phase [uncultured Craurococcus sp.]